MKPALTPWVPLCPLLHWFQCLSELKEIKRLPGSETMSRQPLLQIPLILRGRQVLLIPHQGSPAYSPPTCCGSPSSSQHSPDSLISVKLLPGNTGRTQVLHFLPSSRDSIPAPLCCHSPVCIPLDNGSRSHWPSAAVPTGTVLATQDVVCALGMPMGMLHSSAHTLPGQVGDNMVALHLAQDTRLWLRTQDTFSMSFI